MNFLNSSTMRPGADGRHGKPASLDPTGKSARARPAAPRPFASPPGRTASKSNRLPGFYRRWFPGPAPIVEFTRAVRVCTGASGGNPLPAVHLEAMGTAALRFPASARVQAYYRSVFPNSDFGQSRSGPDEQSDDENSDSSNSD